MCVCVCVCVRPRMRTHTNDSFMSPLCNPMNCSSLGSNVQGIFQARILEGLPFPSPES